MGAGDVYRPRLPSDRRPGEIADAVVVGVGLALVGLAAVAAFTGFLSGPDHAVFRVVNRAPAVLAPFGLLAQVGAFLLVPLVAALALVGRLQRLALELLTTGIIAWLAVEALAKPIATRSRPGPMLPEAVARADLGGSAFPATHLAVGGALLLVASPRLPRWGRVTGWALIGALAVGRAYIGAELPSDLVAGLGVGVAVAGAWRLLR